MSERAPLAGGLKPTDLRAVPSEEAAEVEAATPGGGGGYWAFIAWWYWTLVKLLALVGLVAGFYGLWLLVGVVWNWMGL